MKVFVAGANGQVGWEVMRRGAVSRHQVQGLDHKGLDIADARAVDRVLRETVPDVVINAAAYTAVDRAEQDSGVAFAANRDGPAHLAAACAARGIPLLHLSTDFVFDGKRAVPYREDDPVAPLGVYGLSKWEGEEAVRHGLPAHIILRVSWVFGVHGHNFVKTIVALARQREILRVVADQHGCPTYAGDIADALLVLVDRLSVEGSLPWGTYHYAGRPATTWHGFASAALELVGSREALKARTVIPISTAEYPTPAARPADSRLDCTRIAACFGIQPNDWWIGLEAVSKALSSRH
jgi:dTDP-4-dehydrorhamnose reductase